VCVLDQFEKKKTPLSVGCTDEPKTIKTGTGTYAHIHTRISIIYSKPGAHPKPANGWKWVRARFLEIVF